MELKIFSKQLLQRVCWWNYKESTMITSCLMKLKDEDKSQIGKLRISKIKNLTLWRHGIFQPQILVHLDIFFLAEIYSKKNHIVYIC